MTGTMGARRASVVSTSRSAAAAGEVTMPMRARKGRKRASCAAASKSPSASRLRLELLEGLVERAQARLADLVHGELVAAARLVERDARAHLDLLAVLGPEVEELRPRLGTSRSRSAAVAVLEAEVPVARRRLLHVGELAGDPERLELVLEEVAHAAVQLGDGDDRGPEEALGERRG